MLHAGVCGIGSMHIAEACKDKPMVFIRVIIGLYLFCTEWRPAGADSKLLHGQMV